MHKSTVMTIIRYCIVILLLALFLFFWVDVSDPGFIAVCITLAACYVCFVFGVVCLLRSEESSLSKKRAAIILGIFAAVLLGAAAVKYLLA